MDKMVREIKAHTVMIRCSSGLKLLESDLYSALANEELRTGVCFSLRALCRETNVDSYFLMQTLQPMRTRPQRSTFSSQKIKAMSFFFVVTLKHSVMNKVERKCIFFSFYTPILKTMLLYICMIDLFEITFFFLFFFFTIFYNKKNAALVSMIDFF